MIPTARNTHCLQKQCPQDSPTGNHIGACTQRTLDGLQFGGQFPFFKSGSNGQ